MSTTTLRLREPQVRALLAAVRNKIEDYESDTNEADALDLDSSDAKERKAWYAERLAELRPLERRLNDAGLRLTNGR